VAKKLPIFLKLYLFKLKIHEECLVICWGKEGMFLSGLMSLLFVSQQILQHSASNK